MPRYWCSFRLPYDMQCSLPELARSDFRHGCNVGFNECTDMNVYMVLASSIHHGSYQRLSGRSRLPCVSLEPCSKSSFSPHTSWRVGNWAKRV